MRPFLFVVALTAATAAIAPLSLIAHEYRAGTLTVQHPWTRATPAGASTAAGYMTILNRDDTPDTLLSITSPAARAAEVHTSNSVGGVMRMRPASSVTVPARGTLTFAPGGMHIMLTGLTRSLRPGAIVPAMLRFRRAGLVEIGLKVEPLGDTAHAH